MGTASTIAILNNDGTVEKIHATYSGYVHYSGVMLLVHFNDLIKIKELIKLGDISELNREIHPPFGVKHTFQNPAEDVTLSYGRDRGESGVSANKYASYEEYLAIGVQEPFNYLFDEKKNKWFFIDPFQCKLNEKTMKTTIEKQSLTTVVKDHRELMNSTLEADYVAYLKDLKIKRQYKKMQKELSNQEGIKKKIKI